MKTLKLATPKTRQSPRRSRSVFASCSRCGSLSTAALLLLALVSSCVNTSSDCDKVGTCEPSGFTPVGGSSAGGSSHSSRSSGGGASVVGGSSENSGGVTAAYSSSTTAPCGGECKGDKPQCDAASNRCVECVKSGDCKDPSKKVCGADNTCVTCASHDDCRSDATKPVCDSAVPGGACVECTENNDCKDASKSLCDTSAKVCVSCLATADCKDASNARCDTEKHECAPCKEDADCSQIDGKGVCDAGVCVQCTVEKEGACEGKSCHPKKHECTSTVRGSRNACETCEADSECIGGEIKEPTARCVPMTFGPTAEAHGTYCLQRRATAPCSQPFMALFNALSASGAGAERYCGINQQLTTCEAVRDLIGSKACTEVDGAAECGAGKGGLCKKSPASDDLRCTIPCDSAAQCLGSAPGNTCDTPAKPWCQ